MDLESDVIDRRSFLTWVGGSTAALLSASSLAALLFESEVSAASAAGTKVLGVGQPDRTADFYGGFLRSIKSEAKKRGWEILQSFSGNSVEAQVAELNAWIARGVNAIVVLPRDAKGMGPIVQKCHQNGIVFIGYANVIPGEDGYIVWNDPAGATAMGKVVGKFINQKLNGQAEVGLLTYVELQATRDRINYARTAIAKTAPGAKFFETPAVLAPDALKATQSLLVAHPNMKVIVCCADDGALGARQAFLNSGRPTDNVFICGYDGSKQNLKLIRAKDKIIRASGALDIALVGRMVVDIPDDVVHHRKPTSIKIPYKIVTDKTPHSVIDRLLQVYQ
jgi:ribose transport system substrate-binding protein